MYCKKKRIQNTDRITGLSDKLDSVMRITENSFVMIINSVGIHAHYSALVIVPK